MVESSHINLSVCDEKITLTHVYIQLINSYFDVNVRVETKKYHGRESTREMGRGISNYLWDMLGAMWSNIGGKVLFSYLS